MLKCLNVQDKELTKSYRLETATKLKQVEELSDVDHPIVFHVTRCSSCHGQLDLPSLHFMCNHSYHQRYPLLLAWVYVSLIFYFHRCIAENETECPSCAREHGVIREIRLNHEKLANQHDVFVSDVQDNGFEAVACAFSRGLLNASRLEEAA